MVEELNTTKTSPVVFPEHCCLFSFPLKAGPKHLKIFFFFATAPEKTNHAIPSTFDICFLQIRVPFPVGPNDT